jgi:hypothetical protein
MESMTTAIVATKVTKIKSFDLEINRFYTNLIISMNLISANCCIVLD